MNSTPLAQTETEQKPATQVETPVMQANTNTAEDAPPETAEGGEGEATGSADEEKAAKSEEPKPLLTRNQLWLNTRNFLGLHRLTATERHVVPFSVDWNKDGKNAVSYTHLTLPTIYSV